MSRLHAGQDGLALVMVIVLMGVMMTTGLTLAATVDTQSQASREQRVRDSAFNLAESLLNAQLFALTQDWPGLGAAAAPYATCTQATPSSRCPSTQSLAGGSSFDLSAATWSTEVHDDLDPAKPGTPSAFYSETTTRQQPGYDANGNNEVWVRAQATAKGKTRTLVARVSAEKQAEDLPHAAVIAQRLTLSNNGNKTLIDAAGGQVLVGCTPVANESSPCLGHTYGTGKYKTLASLLDFLSTQIAGATPSYGIARPPAMTADARARLKKTSQADGTYFLSCPSAAQLTGPVVYVEAGNCSYASNTQFNSPSEPGVLVLASGSVSFSGNSTYYGVVYAANEANSSGALVQTQGSSQINGGVIVDGNGRIVAGSSGVNVKFDLNTYRAVASYGTAGILQNTWREITPGG